MEFPPRIRNHPYRECGHAERVKMTTGLNIAFFGSSLVSSYWNNAASYYRGIVRGLHEKGHRITFYEPDAFDRQKHRDMGEPEWAKVQVYSASGTDGVMRALEKAKHADLIIKASGIGVFDELLESEVLEARRAGGVAAFWDVDVPATLERLDRNPDDTLHTLIPRYDLVFTYGGGAPVVSRYLELGAAECTAVYNALDPAAHHPVMPVARYEAHLAFLGNRLADRENRIDEFFFEAAARLPRRKFLLGGSGWADKEMPSNVRHVGHVSPSQHNAFNCTPLAVLNVGRESTARFGYSPPMRVFEKAGSGACIITDAWKELDTFFEPDREILVAKTGEDVVNHMASLDETRAKRIGRKALHRVLRDHTYTQRAQQVHDVLEGRTLPLAVPGV
jgi:spore maturation protein CgeB